MQVDNLSDGFDTQFAGSPLFAGATLRRRPTRAGATTTTMRTTALQLSSPSSIQSEDE